MKSQCIWVLNHPEKYSTAGRRTRKSQLNHQWICSSVSRPFTMTYKRVQLIISFLGIWPWFAAPAIINCDKMFIHTDEGPINGTFSSPNYGSGNYPPDLQCIYTFVAKPNYRVKLFFETFALLGTPTTCDKDYLDIYAEIPDVDINIMNQPLSGRYCGTVSPRIRISLHNVIVLVFHTRSESAGAKGFGGTYQFIPGGKYKVGTPAPPGTCGFTIDQAHKKKGTIFSPTYPGAYPRNLHCYYRFKGAQGQRIKLFFRDFEMYFGGEHCPYDALTVYDGDSNTAPIIRKFCGLQQNINLFSKKENLYLEFVTKNPPQAEHRGFQIDYVFSRKFVDVERMIGHQSYVSHRRGTECDIRVKSSTESTHIIQSPNYPHHYPPQTNCTYILDGLQGDQDLEKVILTFQAFSISSRVGDCEDAFLAVYETGQDWQTEQPDGKFCSTSGAFPPTLSSEGPRMVLVFQSANKSRDQGFKATVRFMTDFGIPGDPVEAGKSNECKFMFNASKSSDGYFNSPRYPNNYPLQTNCTYYLNGNRNDRVRIFFEQFSLHRGLSAANECGDWLELYDIFPDRQERKISRYCANTFPGPIVSSFGSSRIRVHFHSDGVGSATGFKANYDFASRPVFEFPKKPENDCGGKFSGTRGHWFASPNFPNKYGTDLTCNWLIKVRKGYRVLLKAVTMAVEGSMGETVNCQQAAIRVYTKADASFDHEFCGEVAVKSILSQGNTLKITFITSPEKVNGLDGFNFSWTEVKLKKPGTPCNSVGEFRCLNNKEFCIDQSLRCDGVPNCGDGDNSDEAHCEDKGSSDQWRTAMILGSTGGGLLLVLILVIFCVVFQRKYRKKKKPRHSRTTHRHKQQHHGSSSSSYKMPLRNFDRGDDATVNL